jgi:hypothetical protein
VGQHDRDAGAVLRPLVHRVNGHTVHCDQILWMPIERRLRGVPVETVDPVRQESSQILLGGALRPADARNLIRPTGPAYAITQVLDDRVGHVDGEGFDRHGNTLAPGIDPATDRLRPCHALSRRRRLMTLSGHKESSKPIFGRPRCSNRPWYRTPR